MMMMMMILAKLFISVLICSLVYSAKRKISPSPIELNAAKILQRASGDINMAQAILFEEKVNALKIAEPEVFASLIEQRKQQQADVNMIMESKVHSRLVEITWDVIGSFLSMEPIDENIAVKCQKIAEACGPLNLENGAVLDVGCGDGVMFSYLRIQGIDESRYVGIDLSSTMIAKAKSRLQYEKSKLKRINTGKKEKDPTFIQGNFLSNYRCQPPTKYSTILFNGVFQFFAAENQWNQVLEQARSLVNLGSRVVISHVNGADFVKLEKAKNSATCLSIMPTVEELNQLCDAQKFRLLFSADNLDDFYLVVLEAI